MRSGAAVAALLLATGLAAAGGPPAETPAEPASPRNLVANQDDGYPTRGETGYPSPGKSYPSPGKSYPTPGYGYPTPGYGYPTAPPETGPPPTPPPTTAPPSPPPQEQLPVTGVRSLTVAGVGLVLVGLGILTWVLTGRRRTAGNRHR